jgi:predicted ribosomally synthesized peptide with SipW-like signal peptide
MKTKSLKKALICSVMSLVMCLSMLVGTTFAWFTDSVTNNVNQIVSGNLDVELWHTKNYSEDATDMEVVNETTALYDELLWADWSVNPRPTLWQPDVESFEEFHIENKGSLPLKYKFSINFTNATTTTAGKTLADILVVDAISVNHDSYMDEIGTFEGASNLKNFVLEGTLNPGEVNKFVTAIAWTPSVNDNEFNVAGGLKIDLGVTLVATQLNDAATLPEVNEGTLGEDDDVNDKLDDPTLTGIVVNNLTSDIVVNANNAYLDWGGAETEKIVINGNGNKITLDTDYWSRLGLANPSAVLVINDATITSTQMSGTWNSYDVTFTCNVELNNVKLEKALALDEVNAKLTNVEITETNGDYYALWIVAGSNVEIDGLKITTDVAGEKGRGIKIDAEYVDEPKLSHLSIKNAEFTTYKKSAILVDTPAGAEIVVGENVNIAGCVADSTNVVWVDSDAAAYYDSVVVTGATKINEP